MSSVVRPRNNSNENLPPKKRARLMANQAVESLTKKFTQKINLGENVYNLGTITDMNQVSMGVRLSRKLVNDLKGIYKKSYEQGIEYAGSTRFSVNNVRGAVKFNTPTQRTNNNFKKVNPSFYDLGAYIVYHTHPVPVTFMTQYVTMPSIVDFTAYIGFYPYVQANIILEKHGYYVIDLIESDQFKKPNPKEVFKFFIDEVYNKAKFKNVSTTYKGVNFFKASPESLQRVINNYADPIMRRKYGISIRYYRYNELANITLIDRERIMVP
jgi:hypothetical protein